MTGLIGSPEIPKAPRITRPFLINLPIMLWANLIGIAKLIPWPPPSSPTWNAAVLIPIRLPLVSMSAPPELPALIAASVCKKSK